MVFVPLAILRKTRAIGARCLFYSSFVLGSDLWLLSVLVTDDVFGTFVLLVGLLFFGAGVVPLAGLALLYKGLWSDFVWLLVYVIAVFAFRVGGAILMQNAEEDAQEQEELSRVTSSGSSNS